jgi:hypothetical protein
MAKAQQQQIKTSTTTMTMIKVVFDFFLGSSYGVGEMGVPKSSVIISSTT